MTIDLSDALMVVCLVMVAAGLYLVAWPLVLVWIGLVAGYVGMRRSA